jgi:NADH:ubiquinone oxidoreductase subunit K
MDLSPWTIGLIGTGCLLGVGFYGLLVSRNLIKLVIALQISVKAVLLGLVAAGAATGQINLGQSMASIAIIVDTIVAVIGIALAVQIRRVIGTLDVGKLTSLRG